MRVVSLILFLVVMGFLGGIAQAGTCKDLGSDLAAMQSAQKELLKSFVNKNDSMASSLDAFAFEFSKKEEEKMRISAVDIAALRKSAEAFRNHKQREASLVNRFEKASQEVVAKVQSCLSQNETSPPFDKVGQR